MINLDGKYEPLPWSGCWIWNGPLNPCGYPMTKVAGCYITVTRLILGIENDDNHRVYACHKCDEPSCVNPAHLFVGSPPDNVKDSINKGRWPKGHRRGNTRLTDSVVAAIKLRAEDGLSSRDISEEFSVPARTVRHMLCGDTWKHVGTKWPGRT